MTDMTEYREALERAAAAESLLTPDVVDGWDPDAEPDTILSGLMWDWPGTDWDLEPPF